MMQSMIELFGWSKPDHRDINMAVFKFENATGCHFEWRKKMATIVVWRHQSIPWLLRPVHCSPLRFFWYPSLFQQSKGRGKILIFEYFPSPLRAFYYRYFSFIIFFFINLITLEFLKFPHVSVLENQPSRAQLLTEFNQPHSKSIPSNLLVI